MRIKGFLPFLTCALMLVMSRMGDVRADLKFDPGTDWESTRTSHFRIHFPKSYQVFSGKLAQHLENAFDQLSEDLHWTPGSPIEIVVRGDVDQANGFGAVFPLNRIIIHPIPFPAVGILGEYGDWIQTLAVHELTHIVANDTTRGVFSLGRSVFGSASKINPLQPHWLIEGLAVYEETRLSLRGGRGRSAFVDMILRTTALEGYLNRGDPDLGVTLDRLNEGPPVWPGSWTSYLYGYVMSELLAEAGGDGAPGQFSYMNGGRVPFLIDGTLQSQLGLSFEQLWTRAVGRLYEIAQTELKQIQTEKASHEIESKWTDIGRTSRGLAFLPELGKVAFIRDSYTQSEGLSVFDVQSREIHHAPIWDWGGGSQVKAAGREGFIYSRITPFNEYRLYSDLFYWDAERGKETRLTFGARAQDADVSPGFEWDRNQKTLRSGKVVYVKNEDDANQSLAIWDGVQEKEIFRGRDFARIASPAWGRGPYRDWIAFTYRPISANSQLVRIHAQTGEVKVLLDQAEWRDLVTPSWTQKGDLLFSAARGGVYNLYRMSGVGPVERLTRMETGAFYPIEYSGDILLAMTYSARGFDISQIKTRPTQLADSVKLSTLRDQLRTRLSSEKISSSEVRQEEETYSVFPSLWPKYWSPFGQRVPDGWTLGVRTTGMDALEIHHYGLELQWDTRAQFPLYNVQYRYDGAYPSVQLEREQMNQYLGQFKSSNLVDNTSLLISFPIVYWMVQFGTTWTQSNLFGQDASSAGLQVRFAHNQVYGSPSSIDRDWGDRGHRADLTLRGYFIGDQQFSSVLGRWEERVPSFWKQHFFRFYANAGRSTNRDVSASYFVGGGEANIVSMGDFLLRGYQPGAIFGRTLATFNLEYWMPLVDVFRGVGIFPVQYNRAKLKFFVDTGSGEFVNTETSKFSQWPVGVGAHLLHDIQLIYRFPMTIGVGFDWGLSGDLGGRKQVVFGIFGRFSG